MTITRDEIFATLAQITDPISGKDIVAAEIVRALTIEGGEVRFIMEVASEHGKAMEAVRAVAVAAPIGTVVSCASTDACVAAAGYLASSNALEIAK